LLALFIFSVPIKFWWVGILTFHLAPRDPPIKFLIVPNR